MTYYEFFAGGGMARLGLGPRWKCVFANEWCAKKAASYRAAFGEDKFGSCPELIVRDVATLSTSELHGQADLAWASFPCQDLSVAGNGLGLAGARSGTFHAFWRLIKGLRTERRSPRLIVLENVIGALTSHGGADFRVLIQAIIDQGYRVGAFAMDAKWFLPQSRPRLFIVAVGGSQTLPVQFTTEGPAIPWHSNRIVEAYDHLDKAIQESWVWWNLPIPPKKRIGLADIIDADAQGVDWNSEEETQRLLGMMTEANLRKIRQALSMPTLTVGTLYRRTRSGVQRAEVRFDGLAGCLRTPAGGSSRQTLVVVRSGKVRTRLLSPREVARLMGVEDDYPLPDNYNDAYHLFGDGLAVPCVEWISRNLLTPLASAASAVAAA